MPSNKQSSDPSTVAGGAQSLSIFHVIMHAPIVDLPHRASRDAQTLDKKRKLH
jgi:hypothetical protein